MKKKIAILGASGFLGEELTSSFTKRGDMVIGFSRKPKAGSHYWNPDKEHVDPALLEGVDVVINLAGESIVGRWSKEKMHRIRKSRIDSTRFLVKVLLHLNAPPKLYIGASAMGYYGENREEELSEKSSSGHSFLATLCREWEESAEPLQAKMRCCFARFGMVLGREGGALKKMLPAFRLGLGGKLGSGKQYVSWIAAGDVALAMEHVIEHEELQGPINFTSPFPLTNEEFTKTLARVLRRPAIFPVPAFMLTFLFGSGASIFLSSLRVLPKVLLESGYSFSYPKLEGFLKKHLAINSKMG